MIWPYEFLTLSDSEKALRRTSIDSYARLAFWSSLAPPFLVCLFRLLAWVHHRWTARQRGRYTQVPGSPAAKARGRTWEGRVRGVWIRGIWWMGGDVWCWGRRGEWVGGGVWMAWLLFLSVHGTGKDYLHLTKRLGAIASSQLPLLYLLSLKSTTSPLHLLLHSSHETLNPIHRTLARIVLSLLALHVLLYNLFLILSNLWLRRFFAPVVFAGVLSFAFLSVLGATALARVRHASYRVFFVTHLLVAFAVPVLVFIHAPSVRVYVGLAMGCLVVDLAARKMATVQTQAVVEAIPGTQLVKVTAEMPKDRVARFRASPGTHLYLNLPAPDSASVKERLLCSFLYNPFTVVSADETANKITFIVRTRSGPLTTRLASSSHQDQDQGQQQQQQQPLNIEGPYGTLANTFPSLLSPRVTRVLLVAGGVGATFAVPVYHALLSESPGTRMQFVWAVRTPGDATWTPAGPDGGSLMDDDRVHVFLTGDMGVSSSPRLDDEDGVEMASLQGRGGKRPDLRKIVDDAFRTATMDETVAVLVCGPEEMGREVRRCVTPWVEKGRDVWWHNESFAW